MLLCSMLIGFSVSQEIVDITLCELLRRRLFQKTKESPLKEWKPLIFMASLEFHALLRRFVILPLTLIAAVALILYKGGNALEVCMNTVALLFLLDCDNLFYNGAVPDDVQDDVNKRGHVTLRAAGQDYAAGQDCAADQDFIRFSKNLHIFTSTFTLFLATFAYG